MGEAPPRSTLARSGAAPGSVAEWIRPRHAHGSTPHASFGGGTPLWGGGGEWGEGAAAGGEPPPRSTLGGWGAAPGGGGGGLRPRPAHGPPPHASFGGGLVLAGLLGRVGLLLGPVHRAVGV